MSESILAKVRKQMMESAASEHEVLAEGGGAEMLWQQLQDLRREMNQVKKAASDEAAKPYLEEIAKAEKRYALLIKLSSQ